MARGIADALDALLLPAIPYGETWLTAGYPGTVSLAPDTVTAIAVDIGRSIATSGARALVVVNGDFGNRAPLQRAVRLLGDDAIAAIVLDLPGLDAAAARARSSRPAAAGMAHAEEIETSLMLDIAPEQVRRPLPDPVYPHFPTDFGTRPMQLHPFSPTGVFGDPRPATARKGAALLDAVIAESLRVLTDFLPADS